MTNDPAPVDDNDLHAWVDDRLDPARRAIVERHLAQNPAVRQRVADWAGQAAELRRALRQHDAPGRHAPAPHSRPPQRRWVGLMATAAAILLATGLGAWGGWSARGDARPTEIARLGVEAAAAYRILGTDPGQPIEASAANRADMRAMLATSLGRTIALPDLSSLGYRLTNGRVLPAIYGPAAMLTYGDADGNRITVYLQPMRVGEPASMRPIQTDALNGYAWIDGKIGYTVLSEDGKERLHAAADQVRRDQRL